jgi:SAM-dependent methyltransferase
MDHARRCLTPSCDALATEVLKGLIEPRIPHHPFSFWCCRGCGVGFVAPQPDPAAMASLYRDYAYHGAPDPRLVRRYRQKLKIARWASWPRPSTTAPNFAGRALERLVGRSLSDALRLPPTLPLEAAILDVGFGDGSWLLAMRSMGYSRLYGFDLQVNSAASEALEAGGVVVLGEPITWPAATFDCARLEHVFEHLDSPLESLEQLYRALRPGGLLVMTMPSIHAWEPVDELPRSPHIDYLQLPFHLFHHSIASATAFVTAAGFQLLHAALLAPHTFLSIAAQKPPQA